MGTRCEAIPVELRRLKRWVCASEGSKRPLCSFADRPASVDDASTWGTFEEAAEAVRAGRRDWLGFVFADDGYVGVDIDGAFGSDGLPSREAVAFMRAAGSYAEVSKSGRGLHVVCRGALPFKGRADAHGWEAYRDGRFFVLTGNVVGSLREVADADEALAALVADRFASAAPRPGRTGPRAREEAIWQPDWGEPVDGSTGRVRIAPSYPAVRSGSRHLSLVSLCGAWAGAGCSRPHLAALARQANERYLEPPLPQAEVEQVVRSCERYGRC